MGQWLDQRYPGALTVIRHATLFDATVFVDGNVAATGTGRSKKAAEVAAAQAAWEARRDA